MSWSVDPPVRVGALTCAAIVEVAISACPSRTHLLARAEKRPVMILFVRGRDAGGIDVNGRALDHAAVERRYPGAFLRMTEQMADGGLPG